PVPAIKDCPVHDNPLYAIPYNKRQELKKYGINIGDELLPCPVCQKRLQEIEWEDLEQVVGKEISLDVYKMLGAFINGKIHEGIEILRDIRDFNVKADKILGILVAEWRKFYQAKKLLRKGLLPTQIKKELNIFYADIFFSNLKKITLDKTEKSLRELFTIDYAIKTGKSNPFFALELWFLKNFS
ncbi:MAG: hypothetical protein NC927_00120, partial [Candidatus Omnitrophica bacterium]|nr:hypothetical protein [Candidatus Omnitrophota bacterium]